MRNADTTIILRSFHDRKIRSKPSLSPGGVISIDRPPKEITEYGTYKKLLVKSVAPYTAISSTPERATIEEEGIWNSLEIDRVTFELDVFYTKRISMKRSSVRKMARIWATRKIPVRKRPLRKLR